MFIYHSLTVPSWWLLALAAVFTHSLTCCDFPYVLQTPCNKVKACHTYYRALGRSWARCTGSHPPSSRLTLLSARPAITFQASVHHHPLAGTKLYCFVTEAHRYEQVAQGCYAALPRVGFEPTTCWSQVQCSTTVPPVDLINFHK